MKSLAMLPYYMGFPNESKYAANSIYDISWSVNKNASDKDKKATEDFIKWMVSDEDAKKILSKDMGFAVPFTTFDSEDFQPDNPLTSPRSSLSPVASLQFMAPIFRDRHGLTAWPMHCSSTLRAPVTGMA